MSKETVLLLTKEKYNEPNNQWRVLIDWCVNFEEIADVCAASKSNWNQLVCFQLLVKEARKDE